MAISVAQSDGFSGFPNASASERIVRGVITGDTSYPTGGTVVAAATLCPAVTDPVTSKVLYPAANTIETLHVGIPTNAATRLYTWDPVTSKLKGYIQATATVDSAEIANATDVSADKIPFVAVVR